MRSNITASEVVWKCSRDELVQQLGDAVEHRADRQCEEADDWASRCELKRVTSSFVSVGRRHWVSRLLLPEPMGKSS